MGPATPDGKTFGAKGFPGGEALGFCLPADSCSPAAAALPPPGARQVSPLCAWMRLSPGLRGAGRGRGAWGEHLRPGPRAGRACTPRRDPEGESST